MTRWGAGVGFVVAGIISIGFSAWQFQNNANGNTWASNWDDYCTNWPTEYLRRKIFFFSLSSFFLMFSLLLFSICCSTTRPR
jgi:hypothetical protein